MAETKTKQPREVVDYDIDMVEYFDDLGDDEVDTVTLEVSPVTVSPLVFGPGVHPEWEKIGDPAHRVKVWTGGGLDKTKYKVTVLITTVLDRVEEVEFFIKVKET